MTTTNDERLYRWYDVLDNPKGGQVAHLSHRNEFGAWGHWTTLCGRILPSFAAWDLADTDHERVCAACDKYARRFSR